MYKVIVFGTGKSADIVEECIYEDTEITAYIDNDKKKYHSYRNGKLIISIFEMDEYDFDYIIIASIKFFQIRSQLLEAGVDKNCIIEFFNYKNCVYKQYETLLDSKMAELRAFEQYTENRINKIIIDSELLYTNIGYEFAAKLQKENYVFPKILSRKEAVDKIVDCGYSLSRFGDGEFEIMLGRNRAGFQKCEADLGERLREIIKCRDNDIIIGIADNYGDLSSYNTDAANAIRRYLKPDVRTEHMELLDLEKTYYDAYMTRPYILMRNKDYAEIEFNRLKQIWEQREVVIIEGRHTRLGVGNDLLANCKSVERIVCPSENAWGCYARIVEAVKKIDPKKLVLISLGPAATVLAYDLHKWNYQAIDIGHIDMEYEWFLRGVTERIPLEGKYVHEVTGGSNVAEIYCEEYEQQVIERIE